MVEQREKPNPMRQLVSWASNNPTSSSVPNYEIWKKGDLNLFFKQKESKLSKLSRSSLLSIEKDQLENQHKDFN